MLFRSLDSVSLSFWQVEATKFTEVGFHGRDVDQIIRDLVDAAMVLTRIKMRARLAADIQEAVENKIIDYLCGANSEVCHMLGNLTYLAEVRAEISWVCQKVRTLLLRKLHHTCFWCVPERS